MYEQISSNLKETESIAQNFLQKLQGNEVVAFFGDLGAGKTTFIKSLCSAAGVTEDVTSPTFAILNEYSGKFKIFHFDMYRVHTQEDLYSTGFFDYQQEGLMLIEWAENIKDFLPNERFEITIDKLGENKRLFKIVKITKDE